MTSLPDGYRLVDLPQDRRTDVLVLDAWAFPTSMTDEQLVGLDSPLSWDRTRGVEADDGELVALHASYPFTTFPVPGARTPVSGLTWVGVHPGHRRRGLLRAMITDHFTRSLARGEAVSALFAAEPGIYGRFGYGLAAQDLRLKIPRGAALRDVAGASDVRIRIERLDRERHDDVVHRLHGAVDRPGWATRDTPELRRTRLSDPEAFRGGAESLRIAVAERDGAPVGYAMFRRKESWDVPGPRGTVSVREVVAPDAAVARALWGVLVDLDLMATAEAWLLAPDDPITHLLVDLRAAEPRLVDNVWVRLLDVRAALATRRYAAPVDVVLEVTDATLPANAGRWRLTGDTRGAEVTSTRDEADLVLDVRELGAAYLGGTGLAGLASSGLVAERRPGALAQAATAFGWPLAPVCSWVF
ncbi:GNAT family N-acetyltransferase [Actinotalea ferrariae]|uniref:GNAT family N-acetyltransferase n=1 Tax=Actinotalea ferrariae TaxID=1386098 RepID=UPI001C8C06B3|nr:GNAT family N-acetyltransferase [Actinotalea ferrariae]MBX9244277.1 GNAT family N-acetyltransferase [Actinotalea ferrariae]